MKHLILLILIIPGLSYAESYQVKTPVEPPSVCKAEILKARKSGNLKQAASIANQCCSKSDDAFGCNQYGFFISMGYVNKPEHDAETYYNRSCEAGYAGGCKNIASEAKNQGDKAKAKQYYQKACDLNDGASCGEIIMLDL